MKQHRNRPFQFVLALHRLQGKTGGTDTRYPPHSFLLFVDAPLLLPDLQRKHAYSPADNVCILAHIPCKDKVVPVHALKAYRGSGGTHPLFLNLSIR